MARAVARGAAGHDLAALGNEILQGAHILIIDLERLVGAEPAYFAPASAGPPAHPAPFASTSFARAVGVGARASGARSSATVSGALLCPFFVGHFFPVKSCF